MMIDDPDPYENLEEEGIDWRSDDVQVEGFVRLGFRRLDMESF